MKDIDFDSPISVPYEIINNIPRAIIPVQKLLAKKHTITRPSHIKDSRVYTNITNLKKEFRKFLRLNGKPLIGFDISNCQPLLAAIPFREYSEKKYGHLKDDVLQYQKDCEEGIFYEWFIIQMMERLGELKLADPKSDDGKFYRKLMKKMEGVKLNAYCEKSRGLFKPIFFGEVFYSKNIEKQNPLKGLFKQKYPTCYEAIFFHKGNRNYSQKYKEFPELLTRYETQIMYEVNLEIIRMGYDMVNIFDSLYSDSAEAITISKNSVLNKFAAYGIIPKFKDISYFEEAETIISSPLIIENEKIVENKKNSKVSSEVSKILNYEEWQKTPDENSPYKDLNNGYLKYWEYKKLCQKKYPVQV